ncbi:hypothetical protein D3C77_302740 [compost metagenome]
MKVQDLWDVGRERQFRFRKPHRMQVRSDQLFIRNVQCWRPHNAGHHIVAPLEEILIMRRPRGAVGHDNRGLARSTGTTSALRIIRGRRRYVAQVDGVQGGNINAEFHGR